ncbi:MAG: hypothetical protein KA297_27030 [Kofleriaceae bacterium]|nr:hypothetical protein [Kofleriaceae bacterium]
MLLPSVILTGVLIAPTAARADAPVEVGPPRIPGQTVRRTMAGPFQSSRLFAMPIADVIGAYQLTLSGDASLLQQTGLLTSAGVLAIGFGDIAQLEYRHTAAISVDNIDAPVPALGVQLKLPVRDRPYLPAVAAAFRLGVPRAQQFGATTEEERVTDVYVVGRMRMTGWLTPLRLHGGVRVSTASLTLSGDRTDAVERTLVLPAGGWEVVMNRDARLVGELALVPQFLWRPELTDAPKVDTGLLGRLGLRWRMLPAITIDASLGYQLEVGSSMPAAGLDAVVQWDIRLGAEVFVPWGALLCGATGAFCSS